MTTKTKAAEQMNKCVSKCIHWWSNPLIAGWVDYCILILVMTAIVAIIIVEIIATTQQ